jgi:hypothetical protein
MFKSGYHSVTTLHINKSYKIYWTFNDNCLSICKACVNFQIVHGLLLQFSPKIIRTLLSWKVCKEGWKGRPKALKILQTYWIFQSSDLVPDNNWIKPVFKLWIAYLRYKSKQFLVPFLWHLPPHLKNEIDIYLERQLCVNTWSKMPVNLATNSCEL